LEEALSIGRELGDPWTVATALRNLGLTENILGNYEAARDFLEQSRGIWEGMGEEGRFPQANTLLFLSDLAINQDKDEWATELLTEASEMLRGPGDLNFLAYAVRRLGQVACRAGNFAKATALSTESLRLNLEIRDPRGVMACLATFSAIAAAQGDFDRATELAGAVEHLLTSKGLRLLLVDAMQFHRTLELVHKSLGKKQFERGWARGLQMDLDMAIARATKKA
jgi:tetratricopeptide (TPR) repeat protein